MIVVCRGMGVLLVAWCTLVSPHELEHPRCVSPDCRDPLVKADKLVFRLYNEKDVYVKFKENKHFLVTCASPIPVDDPAMPALPRAVAVDRASLAGCGPPAGLYRDALAALNVTPTQTLELGLLPNDQALVNDHLTGLALRSLEVHSYHRKNNVNLTNSSVFKFFNESNLRKLSLVGVVLTSEDLSMLPDSLEEVSLNVAFQKEPRSLEWLERLPLLTSLKFEAELSAPLSPPSLSKLPRLRKVYLRTPLDLPQNWLRGSAVTTLTLHNCGLERLPENMFSVVNLTNLRLIGNNLTELPKDVSSLKSLSLLDVSENRLGGGEVWRAAASLPALADLRARRNPLGAACPEDLGLSMPSSLRELQLADTGATRVCGAWRALPALAGVDLADNRIAALEYTELKGAARGVHFSLLHNPLRAVDVQPSDLAGCRRNGENGRGPAELRLSLSALRCDCSTALLRELVESCAGALALDDAPCAPAPAPRGRAFLRLRPADLCACPAAYSVPGCSCYKRLPDNATVFQCSGEVPKHIHWPSGPLALRVPNAGLKAVPTATFVELHAPNSSINVLRADDISDTLTVLDLRNNSIAHLSTEVLRRMGAGARRIWLAGNPLACACADQASLRLLNTAELRAHIVDWKDLRCSDGREISALTPSDLCFNWPWLSLSILGFVLTLVMITLIVWRVSKTRIKQFLLESHLCLDWVLRSEDSANDPSKTRSAFISYAFEDHTIAINLVQRLEERGYSTVEHSRDWQPGLPVAEQITHSVECARRTILIVTDHYARSSWGLQEFREAHAHAMTRGSSRVILVVCGLSSPDVLPEDLRLYLRNNTYLSWTDPDFWDKLWRTMPPAAADGGAELSALEPRAGGGPRARDADVEPGRPDPRARDAGVEPGRPDPRARDAGVEPGRPDPRARDAGVEPGRPDSRVEPGPGPP